METNVNLKNEKSENLYKQINDLNKEKKRDDEKRKINRRTQNIVIICLILLMIGLANFYSAILRFDSRVVFDKMLKHLLILFLAMVSFKISSVIPFKYFGD
ncbi:MAG: hypothetical protein IJG31_05210, partial [Fusobacterium sp.]|nr:hypothetical protein [Fusobacterium sp.]